MIVKHGSAVWQGGLREGKGSVSTESGVLDAAPYGFNTRFEGQKGTNPEELLGAAHAACFSMAFANMLGQAGITPDRIDTRSEITLEKQGEGFTVTKAHLVTKVSASGDRDRILAIAEQAKSGCPVSKLFNAELSLDASLA